MQAIAVVPQPPDAPLTTGVVRFPSAHHATEGSGAAGAGEHAAEAAVLRQHAGSLLRYLRMLGADRELAADLAQEAFVVAWQKRKQRLPAAVLATFLRRTARYLWLDHRRGQRRREAAIAAAAERLWRRDCADDGGEAMLAAARACLQRLQGRAAAAVALCYRDGRSRSEIAAELGMQPNGVRTLLARTRQWLGECIRRQRR